MLDGSRGAPGSAGGGPAAPSVLMAGSAICFSDRVMSLLRDEFPTFDFRRADQASLGRAIAEGTLHLAICEEREAAGVLDLAVSRRARVAVAFDEVGVVVSRLLGFGIGDFPAGLSFLPMNLRLDSWLSIVRLLLHGETYIPLAVLRLLSEAQEGREPASRDGGGAAAAGGAAGGAGQPQDALRRLTERERKVLPLIAQGMQNKVIANELRMSEHTAKLHVHNIISKLGVRNRTEAARLYLSRPALRMGA